jgi:hypothetical protein
MSGATGGAPVHASAKTGSTSTAAVQPKFPDITTFLATKYGDTYKAASKDAGGGIPGGEVLRLVSSVQVDISVKKNAWDLVAGAPLAISGASAWPLQPLFRR